MIFVQLKPDGLITQMDESYLVKTVSIIDNEVERTVATEYRLATDPHAARAVHRSVHVTMKKPAVFAEAIAGEIPH